MRITSNYKNAFAEVYEILNLLDKEEYKKIPQNVINAIETNRNYEYNYHINNEIELCKQPMLPETKAILYNIFRDYLSTQNQRQKIVEMQNIEREKLEETKRARYNSKNIFKGREENTNKMYNIDTKICNQIIIEKKESFIKQLIRKIKNIFK